MLTSTTIIFEIFKNSPGAGRHETEPSMTQLLPTRFQYTQKCSQLIELNRPTNQLIGPVLPSQKYFYLQSKCSASCMIYSLFACISCCLCVFMYFVMSA